MNKLTKIVNLIWRLILMTIGFGMKSPRLYIPRWVAICGSDLQPQSDLDFLNVHITETHDLWHVVTGTHTDILVAYY